MSTIRTFILALQTKTTNTTRVLEQHFAGNPAGGEHQLTQYVALLEETDFSGRLPNSIKSILNSWGISYGPELDHLDRWPGKEALQDVLVKAINNNRSVRFFWDLHDGPDEQSPVEGDPDEGDVVVRFHSPRWKLRTVGPDSIIVDV